MDNDSESGDMRLFEAIANPEVTDTTRLHAAHTYAASEQPAPVVDEARSFVGSRVMDMDMGGIGSTRLPSVHSAFAQEPLPRIDESPSPRADSPRDLDPPSIAGGGTGFRERESEAAAARSAVPESHRSFASRVHEQQQRSRQSFSGSRAGSLAGVDRTSNIAIGEIQTEESQETLLEKQNGLLELERLRTSQRCKLTREFTMADSLDDIRFEIRRHILAQEEAQMVSFLRDGLTLTCSGIEMANSRLGPFLNLNGWSQVVMADPSRFDHALTRIFRKYFARKGGQSMSPELEIAWALASSIAMFHFRSQMFSGLGGGGSRGGGGFSAFNGEAPPQM